MIISKNNLLFNNSFNSFLEENNFHSYKIEPIKSDASKRKYFRINTNNNSLIFMDSSKERDSVENFIKMSNWLRSIGLSSPEVLYQDKKSRFLALEDLGDQSYSKLMSNKLLSKNLLLDCAVENLIAISKAKPPSFLREYAVDIMLEEIKLFLDWYCLKEGINLSRKEIQKWNDSWGNLLETISFNNSVTVLRDFHVDNLIWLERRSGLRRAGLLDFQDALIGHPSYDLVSLLQDVRTYISPSLEKKFKYKFILKSSYNEQAFEYIYNILGAQRNTKIIGIFSRLSIRDKKNNYLKFIPYTWELLERNIYYNKGLESIANWFDKNIPKEARRV